MKLYEILLRTSKRESGCLIWLGATGRKYGNITVNNTSYNVHRYVYHLATGFDLNSHLQVRHKCGISLCINPEHLTHGTQSDNEQDKKMISHKHKYCRRGHELTPDNIYTSGVSRACKKCVNERSNKNYAKTKAHTSI